MLATRRVRPRFGLAWVVALFILSACVAPDRTGPTVHTGIAPAITSQSTAVTSTTFVDDGAPALGVVVDAQRRVVDIEANSAAEQAGIRRGDLLIRVGTAPTLPSLDGAKRVLLEAKRESMLPVTISRDGHEVAIEVKLTPRLQLCAASACATVTPVPVGRELAFL